MPSYASLLWRRKGRGLSRRGLTSRTACIGGRIAVISEPCKHALLWLSEPCKKRPAMAKRVVRAQIDKRVGSRHRLYPCCSKRRAYCKCDWGWYRRSIKAKEQNKCWGILSSAELLLPGRGGVSPPCRRSPRDVCEGVPRFLTFQ